MDFELSDDQKMLADTVAQFGRQTSPLERARKLRDDDRGWDPAVWQQMGELGWLAVPFSEAAGGLGGSFLDVAVVVEQLGKTLVPEPYVPSVVLAGHALELAGSDEDQRRWLAPMLEGKTSLAFAHAETHTRHGAGSLGTTATKAGTAFTLTGEKRWVLNGHAANHLVVSATLDGAIALFVVDAADRGVSRTTVKTMDGRHAAMVTFNGAHAHHLARATDAATVIERVLDRGAAAACAEGAAIVQSMLDMTTDYLRTREQFGVKIGTFQALQHRAVDMFVEVELCRSMAILASATVDADSVAERVAAISAAKVQLGTGGKFVAQQAVQLHGGIGVTDEHDIGLYFKRLYALNLLFGDVAFHTTRFAANDGWEAGL